MSWQIQYKLINYLMHWICIGERVVFKQKLEFIFFRKLGLVINLTHAHADFVKNTGHC